MSDDTGGLGDRIGNAIERSEHSQSSLARELGTTSQVVNKWINKGVMPEGKHLVRLPQLLGVSGHWLLTGEGEMVPRPPDLEVQAFRQVAAIVDAARSPEGVAGLLARVAVAVSGQPSEPPGTKDQGPQEGHG